MTIDSDRATLSDVAKLAYVGKTTASDALNDSSRVHPDTKDRVIAAARKLRYRAAPEGVKLKGAQGRSLGILVPPQDDRTLRFGSGMLWASITLILGQALSEHEIDLVTTNDLESYAQDVMPVHAFIRIDDHESPLTFPKLPFGAPMWVLDPQIELEQGAATIHYDLAAIASEVMEYCTQGSKTKTVELWTRESDDSPPHSLSILRALSDAATGSSYELDVVPVQPDRPKLASELDAYRACSRFGNPILVWGLDPTIFREIMPEVTVVSFGEGILETNLEPEIPYLSFCLPEATESIANEVHRCLAEADDPRDLLLKHRLVTPKTN